MLPAKYIYKGRYYAMESANIRYRSSKKEEREIHRKEVGQHIDEILSLKYVDTIEDLNNSYQWRIDNNLDLFPANLRYHDLTTKKRGSYRIDKGEIILLAPDN
jgi:hypothetical protein